MNAKVADKTGECRDVLVYSFTWGTRLPLGSAPVLGQIIYVSSAVTPFSANQLADLLAHCHERNTGLGVTGMLLYKDGNFMQVLEGEHSRVKNLYEHIRRDERHRGCCVLMDHAIPAADFSEWSMAFIDLNQPDLVSMPGYSPFLKMELADSRFKTDPTSAHKLLLSFKKYMR